MNTEDRDLHWLREAQRISESSRDPSTKVGAILTDATGYLLLGAGYNCFPTKEQETPENYANREYKYAHICHAEIGALKAASSHPDGKHLLVGSRLYTSFMPCPSCAAEALRASVRRFVFPPTDFSGRAAEWVAHWKQQNEAALALLDEAGASVSIRHV